MKLLYFIICLLFLMIVILKQNVDSLQKQVNDYNNIIIEMQYKNIELKNEINKLYFK